jgi:hypothetical protein
MFRLALDSALGEPPNSIEEGSDGIELDAQKENCLIIGQNRKGHWVVRDCLGLKAGLFRSFASAVHFAEGEASAGCLEVFVTEKPLELRFD